MSLRRAKAKAEAAGVEDSAVEEITHAVAVVPEAVIRVAVAIKANATVVSAAAQPTDATAKNRGDVKRQTAMPVRKDINL